MFGLESVVSDTLFAFPGLKKVVGSPFYCYMGKSEAVFHFSREIVMHVLCDPKYTTTDRAMVEESFRLYAEEKGISPSLVSFEDAVMKNM